MDAWLRGLDRLERRVIRDIRSLYPDLAPLLRRAVRDARNSPDPAFAAVAIRRRVEDQVATSLSHRREYDAALAVSGALAIRFGLQEGARIAGRGIAPADRARAERVAVEAADARLWSTRTAQVTARRAANAVTRDVLGDTNLAPRLVAATLLARAFILARNHTADRAREGLLIAYGDTAWAWEAEPDACPLCAALVGEVFPAGEPFDAEHPNCRCRPVPA